MKLKSILAFALLASAAAASQATDVYAGAGFPGLVVGVSTPIPAATTSFGKLGVRAEYAGGIKLSHDGSTDGTDYKAKLHENRVGAFVDWFPLTGAADGFRVSAGATINHTSLSARGRGGVSSSINGKSVDLTTQTFDIRMVQPHTTGYLGLGWGHQATAARGLGFFADVGVTFGRFQTQATSSAVGQFGITQSDVNLEAKRVRDEVDSWAVLPNVMVGASYKF